jgi:hypothetical protein
MKSAPVPPYGVAIQQAFVSGDLSRMKKAAAEAEQYLKKHGDIAQALKELREEIGRLEDPQRAGAADVIPYGDPIRAALASGDLQRMKQVIRSTEKWLEGVREVKAALTELKREVAQRKP